MWGWLPLASLGRMDAVSAYATLAAVLLALVLALKAENDTHVVAAEQAQREKEAQARRVSLWGSQYGMGEDVVWRLGFGNFSDQPVTQVQLLAERLDGSRLMLCTVILLLPGGRAPGPFRLSKDLQAERPDRSRLYVEFRDAAGVMWRKDARNELFDLTDWSRQDSLPKTEGPQGTPGFELIGPGEVAAMTAESLRE